MSNNGVNEERATISINGGASAEFPIQSPKLGSKVVDISGLQKQLGLYTIDQGYTQTASCDSAISYVDGDEGVLLYRGYKIADLAKHCSFLEVAYLLLEGELPNEQELAEFDKNITYHTMLHDSVRRFYGGFRRDAHPMAVTLGVTSALTAFYPEGNEVFDKRQRQISTHRLIAKMPTVASWAHKFTTGQPFVYPNNDLSYAANFLNMMFRVPTEDYQVSEIEERAMNILLIIQADHEQNASTSTVRSAGSSWANPFASVGAGIASLSGPIHGGANEQALRMFDEIGSVKNIEKYVEKAKDPNDPFRLMGFGHRVYKEYDPRAQIMRETCHELMGKLDIDTPKFEMAMKLEEIAIKDEYFIEKKLYPNVDFYSGLVLEALKFPTEMFTPLFAVARTTGWIAHWNEMFESGVKLYRPRQRYIGEAEREFISIVGRE